MRKLDPYKPAKLSDRQREALELFRRGVCPLDRQEDALEGLYLICNPYPNCFTDNEAKTAFLLGRSEVMNQFNTECDIWSITD